MIYEQVNPGTHAEFIKRDLSVSAATGHSDAMKHLWLMVVLIALLAAPARADFPDAVAAYDAGDYATTFEESLPLAQQGHGDAQYMVGFLYSRGDGVARDPVQAHLWFSLAAAQGDSFAADALAALEREMTAAQVAKARTLAAAWESAAE
jgi:TPR repeat protein